MVDPVSLIGWTLVAIESHPGRHGGISRLEFKRAGRMKNVAWFTDGSDAPKYAPDSSMPYNVAYRSVEEGPTARAVTFDDLGRVKEDVIT